MRQTVTLVITVIVSVLILLGCVYFEQPAAGTQPSAQSAQKEEFVVEDFFFVWKVVKLQEAAVKVLKEADTTQITISEGGMTGDTLFMLPAEAEEIGKALAGVDAAYERLRRGAEARERIETTNFTVQFVYSPQFGFAVHITEKKRLLPDSVTLNRAEAKAFAPHLQKARAMTAFIDRKIPF